jgi:hypothetical protein
MEVLIEEPHPLGRASGRYVLPVRVLALATLAVGACLLAPAGEVAVAFSHALHVGEKGLDCAFCHPGAVARDAAGLAPVEACGPCHDALDRELPVAARLLAAHYDGFRYRRTPVATLPEEVRFSHRTHVHGAAIDCAACHGDIAASEGIPSAAVTKPDCMGCHAQRGVSNECRVCHEEVDRSSIPATHGSSWLTHHGDAVRGRADGSLNRCELCHDASSSCDACHRESPPRDHTQHFRLRGHGTFAGIDRSRCSACHQRDFCQRCHESTAPLSHVPGFGGTQNRHCTTCHFPVRSSGCATCHAGGAQHPTATPMPPWHSSAMNCRQCHGAGAPLPHPDAGHPCTACHR